MRLGIGGGVFGLCVFEEVCLKRKKKTDRVDSRKTHHVSHDNNEKFSEIYTTQENTRIFDDDELDDNHVGHFYCCWLVGWLNRPCEPISSLCSITSSLVVVGDAATHPMYGKHSFLSFLRREARSTYCPTRTHSLVYIIQLDARTTKECADFEIDFQATLSRVLLMCGW
jgi:hypothetical protein